MKNTSKDIWLAVTKKTRLRTFSRKWSSSMYFHQIHLFHLTLSLALTALRMRCFTRFVCRSLRSFRSLPSSPISIKPTLFHWNYYFLVFSSLCSHSICFLNKCSLPDQSHRSLSMCAHHLWYWFVIWLKLLADIPFPAILAERKWKRCLALTSIPTRKRWTITTSTTRTSEASIG